MTDFGKLNPWILWVVHAHANLSDNYVRCVDAEIWEFQMLIKVSVLLMGTQLLRLEKLSVCIIFLVPFMSSNTMCIISALSPTNLK